MQWRGVRRLSVCLSVNFCANRFFSQANGRIATKLARDGLRISIHPGCAQGQGQGQRSRDTRTFWILGMSYSVIDGLVRFVVYCKVNHMNNWLLELHSVRRCIKFSTEFE